MMTMVSTFLSFLAGGLPKILQIFQDRQDKKHELALVAAQKERELALAERGFIAQARVEEIKLEQIQTQTAAEERVALYQHDMEIGKGASQWMINLRASVRPVVTYIFVLELVAINIAGVWYAYNTGVPFAAAMAEVFSDDEMAILASIIAFHFGGRAFSQK
jgi:hypothetical protein